MHLRSFQDVFPVFKVDGWNFGICYYPGMELNSKACKEIIPSFLKYEPHLHRKILGTAEYGKFLRTARQISHAEIDLHRVLGTAKFSGTGTKL